MRDFEWTDELWCVVKDNGRFAGIPCTSEEEARELANQHEGSKIFMMNLAQRQTIRTKKIYCPVNGWDCPYYKDGECGIEDPINDCGDFMCFWDEDDDYICEDEERTAFE